MNANVLAIRSLLILGAFFLGTSIPVISVAQSSATAQPHELSDAILKGDVEKTKKLIKSGVDIQVLDDRTNQNGRYPLNWAAWVNHVEIINALLDAGADINKPNRSGFTPLHHAIENDSKEAAALLIKRGADLKAINRNGMTPLQFAQIAGRSEIATMMENATKK